MSWGAEDKNLIEMELTDIWLAQLRGSRHQRAARTVELPSCAIYNRAPGSVFAASPYNAHMDEYGVQNLERKCADTATQNVAASS